MQGVLAVRGASGVYMHSSVVLTSVSTDAHLLAA
jgi:hypothetical protein